MVFVFVFFGRTASMINVGLTRFLHNLSHPDKQLTVVVSSGLNDAVQLKTSSPHA